MGNQIERLLKNKGRRQTVTKVKKGQRRKRKKYVPTSGSARNW